MLRPFLLVGVGGSGGKTLRVVRANLLRRLEQAGWSGALPDAWQFLHIDVPTTADGNEPDLPRQLPEQQYQGLVSSGIDYRTIDDALAQNAGSHARDALGGWLPDRDKVNVPASKGAGQYRALGRTITLSQLPRVATAVREARRRLTGTEVGGQLKNLSDLLGFPAQVTVPDPQVVVVASIAGGSGSGAVIDVCDVIRSLGDKWASESVGVLYCPDVFDDLDEGLRRGVRPNSLAALSEIMAGYWSVDGPSESTSELFQSYGISTGSSRRLGPRYPFLVGARNGSVSYKTQNDVYRAMGSSLASWVASASLQDRLSAYTQAQWSATAQAVSDSLRLHPSGTETPFSAIGSARVGLGRDRFRDYAAQHLGRTAVTLLLERHESLRARGDQRPARHLIQEQAEHAYGTFLSDSGLNELGEHDDLIDALQPPKALIRAADELSGELFAAIRETRPSKGFVLDDVVARIRAEVENRSTRFAGTQEAERLQHTRTWVIEIQTRLVDVTARAVAEHGAAVTGELLRRLTDEMTQVVDELRNEADQRFRWASNLDTMVRQELGGSKIVTDAEVDSAVRRAVETLEWREQAAVRMVAVDLIPDLVRDFLEPLAEAVSYGEEGLEVERQGSTGQRSGLDPISSWPEGDEVPLRLQPAPNEFFLDEVASYPATLADLVLRNTGITQREEARGAAEREIVTGLWDDQKQQLLSVDKRWMPAETRYRPQGQARSRASITMHVGAEDLLGRSQAWLNRVGTATNAYLTEGLRGYLDEEAHGVSPAEHARRLGAFRGKLQSALDGGAPLVNINTAVLTRVHNTPLSHAMQFSEIPFPERSAARRELVRMLEGRKQFGPSVEQSFSDRESGHIDVFTVLSEPFEPVVFDSLMQPITSDWGTKRATSADRDEFWRWRRARPLPEALPLHPTTLAEMVRGWFVAALLKQISASDKSIFIPASAQGPEGWVPFESPLLVDGDQGSELLADVLQSLPIALLRVNSEEQLAPMRPYHRLLDLGEGTAATLPKELKSWLQDGRRAQDPLVSVASLEERRADVAAHVVRLATSFDRAFTTQEARQDLLGYPGSFDLRHQIRVALKELHTAIETYVSDEDENFL